jgi:sigma-B regulation protein RsbU (phosphoserine phosphatase)
MKNIKLRIKVLLVLLLISFVTAGVVGIIAFTLGTNTLEEDSYNKLTAIREMKGHQVENYFNLIYDQIKSFSESKTIIEATKDLHSGFNNIESELRYSPQELIAIDSAINAYYQKEFIENLYYRDSTIKYFSVPRSELILSQDLWRKYSHDVSAIEHHEIEFPQYDPQDFSGNILIKGSSTASSLVNRIVDMFKEEGAQGDIIYEVTGTAEGLGNLIEDENVDLIGASHKLSREEESLFEAASMQPLSFRIGTDALVVVASRKNAFLNNLSSKELELVFSKAKKWSDVNPDWPATEIKRFIPSPGSGSYAVFTDIILNGDQRILQDLDNTTVIDDGKRMIQAMKEDLNTIAFFSYNYFIQDSILKILNIDDIPLNNINIRNEKYPLTRPLYLVTTREKMKADREVSVLINYFLNAIENEVGINLNRSEYWPQHKNHRILQYQFIVQNPYPLGKKGDLRSAGIGNSYDKAHRIYHPIIKNYLDRFGFYDIFIVAADSAHIIYSVSKEVDFATDIVNGPYRNTNISKVYKKVMNNSDPNAVCFEDFNPYPPSYNAPASFIASPIFDGDEKIGVLIFQLPIDKINNIMTDGYEWAEVGLGKTGEAYLVGSDYLMRNQSRFLIEDPEGYFNALEKTNIPRETISKIKSLNSTIGLQPIRSIGTQSAIDGNSGTQIFKDYRDVEVLSAFRPLEIEGVDWVIMSEMDKSEAFAPIGLMFKQFLLWFAILLVIILLLSIFFANSISKPVKILTKRAADLADGNLHSSIELERSDEIGFLAHNFEQMRLSVKNLIDELQDINQNLEQKVKERTTELDKAKEAADAILDKSPVPVAVVDISSERFTRVNEAMKEFNALGINELLERTTLDLCFDHERDRPIIIDQLREFGKVEDHELRLKRIGTGEIRWGIISIHPISYLGEEVYILSLIDITERKQMEVRVNEQKLLLENTLESLTHPFYVIDANNYSLLLANSAAKKLGDSGISKCYALTHKRSEPCDSKEDPCPLRIIKETKKPVVLEHTHFDQDNNPRIVEVSGYPIFDDKGEVVQMIEYSIDITDRKKAEQDLFAANQRFQAIVDNLADALIIINEKGIVEFYSPSAEKLFQYSQEEVIGEKINILMPSPHREDHDSYLKNYQDTGIAKVVGIEREVDGRRKDGTTFPARLMISEVKTASHWFFVGLVGDLTERKQAEKQLKTQATAMESAENAIVITDPEGYIQWVNPSFTKLTGYASDEVIGQLPNLLKSGKHEDAFYKQMWDTILEGKVWKGEINNKKKDGALYFEEMTITPVLDHEGEIGQFVAIKQDISERKRLEEIMIKAKKRMEEELNVAKEIQMSMLPLIFPAFPKRQELDVFANLIPAREVGGDFYDFYFLDENHFCFVVGDVSGKGVPAALMMAVTKTLLKSRAGTDLSTASILTHVNNEIAKDNDAYMFITIFLAILNTNTGELVYSNAGHNPSYIMNKNKKKFTKLSELHGPVVGAMEDMTYKETRLEVEKDDIIFAYTDGVTESQNKEGKLYSDPRLELLLQKSKSEESKDIIEEVIADVKTHEKDAEQFDDITVLSVRICQEPSMDESNAINIEIVNNLEEINTAVGQFEQFATENQISLAVTQKLNIVFDELLNNVISYAYKDDEEHIIVINASLRGERLVVTITDDGEPFNPFGKNPPDTMLSLEERSLGGLGIHLVKNLMDEYDYKRNVNKNIITLIKNNVNS